MTKTFYPKGFIEIPTQVTLYERPEKMILGKSPVRINYWNKIPIGFLEKPIRFSKYPVANVT